MLNDLAGEESCPLLGHRAPGALNERVTLTVLRLQRIVWLRFKGTETLAEGWHGLSELDGFGAKEASVPEPATAEALGKIEVR
ncbi:MAG: hypothetical protein JSU87_15245 [Gemmatimonadota bacterium]|nr:MAG: hypothetical protein JSU87_15245 [Gemmatimonadota bacterium]